MKDKGRNKMDGILIVNKEKGYTSHDVVGKLRKIFGMKQIGHTGTLDPNATGVLPILIGKATKASQYLMEHDKTYIATLKLGERTNTLDGEGEVVEKQTIEESLLDKDKIDNVLQTFLGKQEQIPPMYSAIKIKGKKLYEYAKQGKEIEREPRSIEIYEIRLKKVNKEKKEIIFEVHCSKGTYIRVLCEDIAKKIGTIGYMKELKRTKVPPFAIEQALTLEQIEKQKEKIENHIISIEEIFRQKQKIELNEKKYELFLNGTQLTFPLDNDIYRIYFKEKFIGIGKVENHLLKRDIIIESTK